MTHELVLTRFQYMKQDTIAYRLSPHALLTKVALLIVVKVEVILRPTVSRPVRLGVRHPAGTRDQFYFLL
jgi:hypothetical protein